MRFRNGVIAPLVLTILSITQIGDMASAQELSTQLDEATRFFKALAVQSKNPLIAGLARESLAKLQTGSNSHTSRQIVIQLLEQPDASLVVPTMINDNIMGTFLLDTGASYTVITPQMARKLAVEITPDTPKTSIMTANGTVDAPLVTLKNVSIGQIRIPEVRAIVQELGNGDDPLLSGLLGMNVFKDMEITIKEDQLILTVRDNAKASAK